MNDVLRMGKRIFTVSVAVTTIAWSIGLGALLLPLAASAATLSAGDLIKASQPAVYYYGADGKRYVFPNEKTYKTWYSDFSSVKKISDADLAAISIGGNVTYRPGVKMVKITTDTKVYAVDKGGALRWVNSEQVASSLYGSNWAKMVEDIPDAFFVNYKAGADIAQVSDFTPATATNGAVNINVDKGLASASNTTGTGALSIALDASNPMAGSVIVDSGSKLGQRNADMLIVKLSAGASDVHLTSMKFTRTGISKDADVDKALLVKADGITVLEEATSISSGVATFNLLPGDVTVPANSSVTVIFSVNVNYNAATGSTQSWSLASAGVASDAATVSGSAVGNTFTVATLSSSAGYLNLATTNLAPASVDPGTLGKEMWRVSFAAQSQDILLKYVKFTNLGSSYDSDIVNVKLMDAATQLNGVVAAVVNKTVVFDLSNMTGGGYVIKSGQAKQLTLVGDIVGGTNRTFKWTIQKEYDVQAQDMQYGVQVVVSNNSTTTPAFSVINQAGGGTANTATNINYGSLSVSVDTASPSTNIPASANSVTLATYDFKASGEDVNVTALTVLCTASTTTRTLKNVKMLLNGSQVGTTTASLTCDGSTTTAYTFGNSFILKLGVISLVSIVADTTDTNWAAGDTVFVGFNGSGTAQGKVSLTSITPTATNGRTLTLKTGTPTVIKNQSFSDRSTTFPTGVSNAAGVKIASFVVTAGAGEAINVSQFSLYDPAVYFLGQDFQNLVLKDQNGNQVGTTISALNSSASSYTFTPSSVITIPAGGQMAFDVFADVKGSPTNAGVAAHAGACVSQVTATGAVTGASANYGSSAACNVALQQAYIAANGNLTLTVAADTPVAQQQLLGTTGVNLAKFKLAAGPQEDINVTQFIVEDDMSTGWANSGGAVATGTVKNLKLYNGSTLLASVAALDGTYNTVTPNAVFTGFTLLVPKNQNVVLTVTGDMTSYTDGGVVSSTHRIIFPLDYNTASTGIQDAITAVGAGSGYSISSTATASQNPLHIVDTTLTDARTGNSQAAGNYMDTVRAKLTLAFAADSPKGANNAASEEIVAKFVATNSANVGNYSLTIQRLNFAVSSTGNSISNTSAMNVYKDAVATANKIATSNYNTATKTYANSAFASNFTAPDIEVAAGSSRTIIVTLNTANGGFSSTNTLSVGLAQTGAIIWYDGVTSGNYYTCDSLPLTGQTLVY